MIPNEITRNLTYLYNNVFSFHCFISVFINIPQLDKYSPTIASDRVYRYQSRFTFVNEICCSYSSVDDELKALENFLHIYIYTCMNIVKAEARVEL